MEQQIPRSKHPKGYIFDGESVPIPPGTKNRAKYQQSYDRESLSQDARWLFAGVVVVALVVGIFIGHYLF